MRKSGTLSRRLALSASTGIAVIWLLAVLATALVLRSEQEELLNLQLRETAQLFLSVLADGWELEGTDFAPAFPADYEAAEALVYLLVDTSGQILLNSPSSVDAVLPDLPPSAGYVQTTSHVFYVAGPDERGFMVVYGDPLHERFEAYRDSFIAFLLPMLALLPLAYLLVEWIGRSGLRPLNDLRNEIAARGDGRLDPIDAAGQPDELREITATTNSLMIRLGQALDGERAFAGNAAHELRTPLAVALAQIQRLRAETEGPGLDRIERIEAALLRMSRLLTRLLQLARADAGIGLAETSHDLGAILRQVLGEVRQSAAQSDRLRASLPDKPVLSPMDPDAFGILAGNLIENALQHSPEGTPVTVDLSGDGRLRVSNEGDCIDARELPHLTRRFRRNQSSGKGFGLGLHISDAIARQSGGTLDLHSPASGTGSGFEAVFKAPDDR